MAILNFFMGSIFQEFYRSLMESISDLNFEYEEGILKAKLCVANVRTSLRLSRIC